MAELFDDLPRSDRPEREASGAARLREPRRDLVTMEVVDIDGLKMINDTYGHAAGDGALIQVAQILSPGVRRSDCVARLGGDEFGILIEHADEESATETAARLVSRVAESDFCFDGSCLPLSVAIGTVSAAATATRT